MMFWRMLWQLVRASRARLAVALATVVSGSAVISALLSLQLDVERKLAQEFRTLGANIVVASRAAGPPGAGGDDAALMQETVWDRIAAQRDPQVLAAAPYLYIVAQAPAPAGESEQKLIVAGTLLDQARKMNSWWAVEGRWPAPAEPGPAAEQPAAWRAECLVGRNVARQFRIRPGSSFELRYGSPPRQVRLSATGIVTAGGTEDNQVFVGLAVAQQLAGLTGQIALVQLSVAGAPAQVQGFLGRLAAALPEEQVRPVRQLAAAEGQLLGRIRLLILATVVLILALTVLGVLATTAALAMERRLDVGLMKAIGGPMTRVMRLFLTEVGILGGVGGLLGYGLGVALSEWLGRKVFGVGIAVRWEVLPLTLALMAGAALAGALPLRLLGRVRPAVILKGE